MRPLYFAAIAAGLLGLTASGATSAQQQPWLANRSQGYGMGYDVGSFVLHPGVAGELGFDSNIHRRASNENPINTFFMRITPSLYLTTSKEDVKQDKYILDTSISATYNEHFTTSNSAARASEYRRLGVNADVDYTINPKGHYGGRLHGDLARVIEPSNSSDIAETFDRISAHIGAEAIWKPGGGLFDWRLGYEYGTTLFEEYRFSSLNYSTHDIRTRGRWQFLPRSSLHFDASTSFVRYSDPGPNRYLLGSNPIRSRVGYNGLITDRFVLLAMLGWGSSFHIHRNNTPVENFDSPIWQLQVTYYPGLESSSTTSYREPAQDHTNVALGYVRDFNQSYFGTYYGRDRVYLRASAFFAQRAIITGEAGFANIHFPNLFFSTGSLRYGSFNEQRYDIMLHAEYRIIPSVGINITIRYDLNNSINLPVVEGTEDTDNLSFSRFRAFIGARWFM